MKSDSIDDLWSDPAGLQDAPKAGVEMIAFQSVIARTRKPGGSRTAWESVVPKRDGLTRTAHRLDLPERVYYQALVDSFLHDADAKMASRNNVYGYRPNAPRRSHQPFGRKPIEQWLAFHRKVKDVCRARGGAVVVTDIAAFFEQIPHDSLADQLSYLGISPQTTAELRSLLRSLMAGERGIPQGNDASSVVGSVYLTQADNVMLRAFPDYYRYVDDIRIVTGSESEARKALRLLEAEMRKLGLNLQPGKTRMLVGAAAIKEEILDADAEVDAVDYVWRTKARRVSLPKVRKSWNSASRKKAWNKRLIKFLVNRLRMAKSDLAVNWCVSRLGVLDWLAELVAPYLALFVDRKAIQARVDAHLRSDANLSAWEETALLRMFLTAKTVSRGTIDYAIARVQDRNENGAVREWAAVLVGKAGTDADRNAIYPYRVDTRHMARAMVVAFQGSGRRGSVYGDVAKSFPELRSVTNRYKGFARPLWPVFPVW